MSADASSSSRRTSSKGNLLSNDGSRNTSQTNRFLNPTPPVDERSAKPPLSPKLSPSEYRTRRHSNANSPENSSKQIYTFSNPPREHERNSKSSHQNYLPKRVSSAPTENPSKISPRSQFNQQKSSSANQSNVSRTNVNNYQHPVEIVRGVDQLSIGENEQEKLSLHELIKEQQQPKAPKSVQNRRIHLLVQKSATKQEEKPISPRVEQFNQCDRVITPIPSNSKPPLNDDWNNLEPDIADSLQIAAILNAIQNSSDSHLTENSSSNQLIRFNPGQYDYISQNPNETLTYRLSPRTLKPNEEPTARSNISQNYRYEMRYSINGQLPPLNSSIVTESLSTLGNNNVQERTFTFRLNPNGTVQAEEDSDNYDRADTAMDSEQILLRYDATLNGFYDPNTGLYYELTSA